MCVRVVCAPVPAAVGWSPWLHAATALPALCQHSLTPLHHPITSSQLALAETISGLPWATKPVYGFITDSFPICGMRRRPYLILAGLLGEWVREGVREVAGSACTEASSKAQHSSPVVGLPPAKASPTTCCVCCSTGAGSTAWLCMAGLANSVGVAVACMTTAALATAFSDVVADSIVVQLARASPGQTEGGLQSM